MMFRVPSRLYVVVVCLLFASPFFAQRRPVTTPVAPVAASTAATPLDLNTATAVQLKALPGIGDAYANRIVANRPYTMKNQIVQKGIVPQATYDKIKDSIVAKRPAAPAKK